MMRALLCVVVCKLRFGAWVRSHIIIADAVALLIATLRRLPIGIVEKLTSCQLFNFSTC